MSKVISAAEQNLGAVKSTVIPSDALLSADDTFEDAIQVADESVMAKDGLADGLAFMEEKVRVLVHQSSDEKATPIVTVWSNGTPEFFERGVAKVTRRRFVECLARAKPMQITTPEITDQFGGRTYAINRRATLQYPFEVQGDTKKGMAWLRDVLAQP